MNQLLSVSKRRTGLQAFHDMTLIFLQLGWK